MENSNKIMQFLRRYKDNRGAMASLRCLLSTEQKFRGWQLIAGINGIGNVAVEIVAGLYAMHPMEKNDESYNFGDACRRLATDRKTNKVSEESPFDRRFKRLLSCDSRDELRRHLADIVRGLKTEDIPVNYESLCFDITRWGERVREKWAIHYWNERKEEDNVLD